MGDNGKLTYSIAEASRVLGLSKNSCYQACMKGELPHIRIGHRVLVPKARLHEMLQGPGKPGDN